MAEEDGWWLARMKTPRFSKPILEDHICEGKLRIPKGFSTEHGARISNTVLLKLPSGAERRVGVLKSGNTNTIWFHEGWREFAEFCALLPGHFLVFEHVGESCFLVLIFDITGTEIDYPAQEVNGRVEVGKCEDGACGETLEMHSPALKMRDGPPLVRSIQPSKLRRTNELGRTAAGDSEIRVWHGLDVSRAKQGEVTVNSNHHLGEQLEGSERNQSNDDDISQPQTIQPGVPEAANFFTSTQPFFKVAVTPSHLSHARVSIPQAFCKHIKEGNEEAELRFAAKCWGVRIHRSSESNGRHRMFFAGGWRGFADGNSLEVGDVCVYELVNKGDDDVSSGRTLALSVHIFRTKR